MVRPAPTLDRATEAELSVRQQRYRSSAAAHPIESSGMWQWSPGTPSALAIEMHAERRAACEEQLADAPDGALTLVALAPWFDASLHDDVTFSEYARLFSIVHHDHPVAEIVRKNAAVIEQGLGLEAGALTVEPLHIANELINHVIKRLRAKDLISLPLLPETPSKRRWPSTRTLVLPPPLERAQFDANVVNLRVAGALPRELCKVFLDARMVQF